MVSIPDRLHCAIEQGQHADVTQMLPYTRPAWDAILTAIRHDHVEILCELLRDKRIQPCADALQEASRMKNPVLLRTLLDDVRTEHPTMRIPALVVAAGAGHLAQVKMLLPGISAAACHPALCVAVRFGHGSVVAHLLWIMGDTVNHHALVPELVHSLENGHSDLVSTLLDIPGIGQVLAFRQNALLLVATRRNDQDILPKLWATPSVQRLARRV
jgi:hypothetical protein